MHEPTRPHSPLEVLPPRRPAVRAVAANVWAEAIADRLRHADRVAALGVADGAHGERSRPELVPPPSLELRLHWHEREVHSTLPGQYRICAPLSGGPIPRHANATLTRLLDQLWVTESSHAGPTITSVVAIIGRGVLSDQRGRQALTILLTAADVADEHRIHGAGMGRQIQQALSQLTLDA